MWQTLFQPELNVGTYSGAGSQMLPRDTTRYIIMRNKSYFGRRVRFATRLVNGLINFVLAAELS